ncbi:MAG: outer membrane protein transport protein [Candidatus Azobacteroides sp.]|nr:outer membrane protein transport protein [Candidatus Azobacteroides sp.]
MKRNLLFIIAFFVCAFSFGQGEIDAYRYSSTDLSGTARGQAMGGAFGAVGGDVTGVAINPAGIGIYRRSEVVGNMSLTSPLTKGGNAGLDSHTTVALDNLSYVGYYPLVRGGMLSLNFGFNYNRIKSFDRRYSASRPAMNSSLTDYIVALTNADGGINSSAFDNNNNPYDNPNVRWLSALAWKGYLINPANNSNNQYVSILNENEQVTPDLRVREKGQIEAYDFTIGSDISDKFYWGITLSLTDLSYSMTSFYDEQFLGDGGGFNLENYLRTDGSGIQVKVGAIFKPIDALRIGVAYHSPTWYSMTDYFWAQVNPRGIYFDGQPAGITDTPNGALSYDFRTPGSWTVSLATVLGTKAVVSVDYENKNYTYMNLEDNNGNEWAVNKIIDEDYKNTSMLRAGVEYCFSPQFSGRLGYAWEQNPYRKSIRSTGEIVETSGTVPNYILSNCANYFTAGVGFKFTPHFYVDVALVLRTQNDYLYYFPPVKNDDVIPDSFEDSFASRTLKGLITLGYKF